MIVKPFPTQASNCVLPDYVVAALLYQENVSSGTFAGSSLWLCL